jgi:plastocyanin
MTTGSALRRVPTWALVVSIPLATLVTVVSVGFGSSGATGAAASSTAARPDTILIQDFSFSPRRLAVAASPSITVENDDHTAHTLTADSGAFDTGNLGGGGTAQVTVERAGTYRYHCSIHPFMTGTLQVLP